jgi:hypothetical protein
MHAIALKSSRRYKNRSSIIENRTSISHDGSIAPSTGAALRTCIAKGSCREKFPLESSTRFEIGGNPWTGAIIGSRSKFMYWRKNDPTCNLSFAWTAWNVGLTPMHLSLSKKLDFQRQHGIQVSGASVLLQSRTIDGGARKLLFTHAGSECQHMCLHGLPPRPQSNYNQHSL